MRRMIDRVVQVAYHRNGIAGEGFHAVIFETVEEECAKCHGFATTGWVNGAGVEQPCSACGSTERVERRTRMVASVFDDPGQVAVYEVAKLADPEIGVAFGENSWRGDRYEPELREAIKNTESDGSVRVGPFAVPTKRKARK